VNRSLWSLNYLKSNLAYDYGVYIESYIDKMTIGIIDVKQRTLIYLLQSYAELINLWDIDNPSYNLLDSAGMVSILSAVNRILNTNYDYEFI